MSFIKKGANITGQNYNWTKEEEGEGQIQNENQFYID